MYRIGHGRRDIARLRWYIEWQALDRSEAYALAAQILALPVSSRDEWLAQHPEAQTIEVLEALLGARSEPMPVTELVLKHAATVRVPGALELVEKHGWHWLLVPKQ